MTRGLLGAGHPSRPSRLGAKHVRILVQQGLSERYVSAYNAIGRFLLVGQPEHLSDCPFCGHGLSDGGDASLIMCPVQCYGCDRTFWVYCDLKDSLVNGDFYRERAVSLGVDKDPDRAWDEYGIPRESLEQTACKPVADDDAGRTRDFP